MLDTAEIPRRTRRTVSHTDIAARMLISSRIAMWAYGYEAALWLLNKEGGKGADFEVVWDFGSAGENYYALSDIAPSFVRLYRS